MVKNSIAGNQQQLIKSPPQHSQHPSQQISVEQVPHKSQFPTLFTVR